MPTASSCPSCGWWRRPVHQALGQPDAARQHLQTGVRWVNDTAQAQVPEAFRASFVECNPVNAALLALAAGPLRPG